MPRSARGLVDGGVYHILNRGNGRQNVFHKDADYAAFLGVIEQMIDRYEIDLYAYCCMPNHYHLVVKAVKSEDLSDGMRWFDHSCQEIPQALQEQRSSLAGALQEFCY